MNTSEKKPGRPFGSKSGPRPVFWFCVAIKDNDLICESIGSPLIQKLNETDLKSLSETDSDELYEKIRNFSQEEATEIFKLKYQIEPRVVEGPILKKVGDVSYQSKKKTQEEQNFELTPNSKQAIFNNWKGTAFEIKDRADLMFFIYGELINPNLNTTKKIAVPTAGAVAVSELKFLSEIC